MKKSVVALALLYVLAVPAAAENLKSFRLTVGDQTIEINPGETVDLKLPDGSTVKATLERNEYATYAGGAFSFNYPTAFTVAKSEVGKGINQHLIASALGTLVIVQEYEFLNPSSLDKLMMQELTKETVQAGGTMKEEPFERTLAGGQVMSGLKSTVTLGPDTATYEVLTIGSGTSGVIAVTRIDEQNVAAEGSILTTFWDTLALK